MLPTPSVESPLLLGRILVSRSWASLSSGDKKALGFTLFIICSQISSYVIEFLFHKKQTFGHKSIVIDT